MKNPNINKMDVLKFLGMGIVAIFLCVNFTACSKDDEPPTSTTQTEPDSADDEIVTVSLEKAGDLESLLGDNMMTITSLKVSGPLNGDDIYCLRRMFDNGSSYGHLKSLDLKDASIVEGGRYYYRYSSSSSSSHTDYYTSKDKIGEYMFYYSKLKKVVLPDNVTSIESYAFYNCYWLTSIIIPDNVTSIGSYAFYWCQFLKDIIIPDNVTSIGSYAFYHCNDLNVTIGQGVKSIGNKAFGECLDMTSIIIPDNVTSIGSYAFYHCTGLEDVTIGQGLTSIPNGTFEYCSSLKSIIIPENITTIGSYAFYECTYLDELYCYATTPPSINSSSFDKPNIFIYVPKGCLEVYQNSAWGKYFSTIYEMD